MYLRITRGRGDPSRADEVQALTQEIIAVVRQQPGFQHYYGGIDRASGQVIAVSTWDTQEQAAASRNAMGLGEIISRLQALGVQLEPAEVYEDAGHA
jgi:quinol monooxygenase YgiN